MDRRSRVTWLAETGLWNDGYRRIVGLDEAGRGALAGPVVAAAVMFPPHICLDAVDDSKQLGANAREVLFEAIQRLAMGIGVGIIEAEVIDRVNIRQGTLLAMEAAIRALPGVPECLLIDGRDMLSVSLPQRAVIHGDQTVGSIAAASIVAKVTRDRLMQTLHAQFPGYGMAQHKGYGTAAHLWAIRHLGPSPIHRRTFRGVLPVADEDG
jgi:ribonuclease HII